MAAPVHIIRIHYSGPNLSLHDTDDQPPLYSVKINSTAPQMSLFSAATPTKTPLATASFSPLSLAVSLSFPSHDGATTTLQREATFTRAYTFRIPRTTDALFWRVDGVLSGDFKLQTKEGRVLARFRNKVFSTTEVGSFEIGAGEGGVVEEGEREEWKVSGLATLAMVQSGTLGLMVMAGGGGK